MENPGNNSPEQPDKPESYSEIFRKSLEKKYASDGSGFTELVDDIKHVVVESLRASREKRGTLDKNISLKTARKYFPDLLKRAYENAQLRYPIPQGGERYAKNYHKAWEAEALMSLQQAFSGNEIGAERVDLPKMSVSKIRIEHGSKKDPEYQEVSGRLNRTLLNKTEAAELRNMAFRESDLVIVNAEGEDATRWEEAVEQRVKYLQASQDQGHLAKFWQNKLFGINLHRLIFDSNDNKIELYRNAAKEASFAIPLDENLIEEKARLESEVADNTRIVDAVVATGPFEYRVAFGLFWNEGKPELDKAAKEDATKDLISVDITDWLIEMGEVATGIVERDNLHTQILDKLKLQEERIKLAERGIVFTPQERVQIVNKILDDVARTASEKGLSEKVYLAAGRGLAKQLTDGIRDEMRKKDLQRTPDENLHIQRTGAKLKKLLLGSNKKPNALYKAIQEDRGEFTERDWRIINDLVLGLTVAERESAVSSEKAKELIEVAQRVSEIFQNRAGRTKAIEKELNEKMTRLANALVKRDGNTTDLYEEIFIYRSGHPSEEILDFMQSTVIDPIVTAIREKAERDLAEEPANPTTESEPEEPDDEDEEDVG